MKTRKGGFTLVELLIVIMIIAILAGMMMIATSSATDSAEATKIINNLRNLKSAALLYYGDNMSWPQKGDQEKLDRYTDRKMSDYVSIGTVYSVDGVERYNIGLRIPSADLSVRKKLAIKAQDSGLLDGEETADAYKTTANTVVWMNMR
jgi:general secretion pathway protein G